jgi:hypothetical protein
MAKRITLREDINTANANRDPISGESGAHPIGTALGAGGAATVGAVIGAAAGPAGSVAGAVSGAIAGAVTGGLYGSGIVEMINPTEEEIFWNENYSSRPYVAASESFETYQPTYRFGLKACIKNADRSFDEAKSALQNDWKLNSGSAKLDWARAEPAIRDSYERTGNLYKERLRQSVKTTGSANSDSKQQF